MNKTVYYPLPPCSPQARQKESEKLFTLITPEPWQTDEKLFDSRVKVIRLERVYSNQAQMGVRTAIRQALYKNAKNYDYALSHAPQLNDIVGAAVIKEIKNST